ncbi:MAG: hypothetical protein Greene041619_185 [Candidatus Peregrinibacteria bacterium Greene0416_19]|nr:MAG: hypothetical protein Greene041619_185 [Candidatus Peregrinibacteria bacterium Greene0416_19]
MPVTTAPAASRATVRRSAIAAIVILILFVIALHLMGRIPVCKCGVGLWTWSAWSSQTSQHLGDPYSTSHVLHGIIFFAILAFAARRLRLDYRFLIALMIEVGWELLENSLLIINRYRSVTASLDYTGDSILNSTGDVLFMMLGFWLAWKLRWQWTLAIVITTELLMLVFYRDNLTLNILMLLYPVPAIRTWQSGG